MNHSINTNPLKQGALTEHSAGLGTVTRQMVHKRAQELATIDGRDPQDVTKADWELAKQELIGDPSPDENEEAIETAPESDRWNPVAGSTGSSIPVAGSEDEDAEGRSDHQRLIEEGIAEAAHDQMLQAALKMKTDESNTGR
ncbi:MAG: hypothetical protein JNN07_28905 [Verrucomicrobiales bacterium]|nr:hypothetical protein [Verrucomicrobiales bacterium]